MYQKFVRHLYVPPRAPRGGGLGEAEVGGVSWWGVKSKNPLRHAAHDTSPWGRGRGKSWGRDKSGLPAAVASGFVFGVELLGEEDGAGEVLFPGLFAGDFSGGFAAVEDGAAFGG